MSPTDSIPTDSPSAIRHSSFHSYEKYKDSGVEWIGEIPEHWKASTLRELVSQKVVCNRPDLPTLSVYREFGVIPKDSRDDNHNATSLDTTNYKVVEPGDLAVNKMKAWQGSMGVSDHHGIVSPAYITCDIDKSKAEPRFVHYLLRSKPFVGAFDSISYGVRIGQWDMRFEDFKKVGICFPTKPEQNRIVEFLDRKTAEIDELIAKKQRQIELLDELQAIRINLAVTKGIVNKEFGTKNPFLSTPDNPVYTTHQSPLKPSGIEWLGEIPEEWTVAPMYSRCDVKLGKMLDEKRFTGRFPGKYLRNTDVQWGEINTTNLPVMDFKPAEQERYRIEKGDLLVCEGGEPGRAAIWESDDNCFYQKALHRVRSLHGDLPTYIWYLFKNAVTNSAFRGVDKATIMHLTGEQLRRFRLVFPNKNQQQVIVEYLCAVTSNLKKSKCSIEKHIRTLQTLRSSLISQAVTGKIKIKNHEN